jgi:hypothetical protein
VSRAATLSNVEPRFICSAWGERGAAVRPDFNWNRKPAPAIGFRNVTFLTDKARLKGQGRHVHSLPALANRALP